MRAIAVVCSTTFLLTATLAAGPVGAIAGIASLTLCAVLP